MTRALCVCALMFVACHDWQLTLEECRDAGRCVRGGGGGGDGGGSVATGGGAGGGSVAMTSLSVAPGQLDFGDLAVGDTSAGKPLVVTNSDAGTAFNLRVMTPVGFVPLTAVQCPTTLGPGERCTAQVAFNPGSTAQAYDAMGTVVADNAPAASFRLTGNGVASDLTFTPPGLDFSLVELDAGHSQTFTLRNTSSAAPVTSLSFSVEHDAGVFTFTNVDCGATLPSMSTCQVRVDLLARVPGAYSAAVTATGAPAAMRRLVVSAQTATTLSVGVTGGLVAERVVTDDVDGGFLCSGSCQQLLPHGTARTFRFAATRNRTQLLGWSGACSGRSTCSVQLVGPPVSVAAAVSSNNYAFVTRDAFNGNLGGFAGADMRCDLDAADAGLPAEGYRAFLARWDNTDPGTAVLDHRFPATARGWVRLDGQRFADTQASLEQQISRYPLLLDARGQRVAPLELDGGQLLAAVWTGAELFQGRLRAPSSCCPDTCGPLVGLPGSDWTSSGAGRSGRVASMFSDFWYASGGLATCNLQRRLYCFGVGQTGDVPAPQAAPGARRAFITATATHSSLLTRAQADAVCNNEAMAAGIMTDAGYAALRGDVGTAPLAGFDLDGGAWYRPDGVAWFDPASGIASGAAPASPLSVTAAAVPPASPPAGFWLGASAPLTPGTLATTCNGWAPDSGFADVGEPLLAVPNLWTIRAPAACGFSFMGWAAFASSLACLER